VSEARRLTRGGWPTRGGGYFMPSDTAKGDVIDRQVDAASSKLRCAIKRRISGSGQSCNWHLHASHECLRAAEALYSITTKPNFSLRTQSLSPGSDGLGSEEF
jgi:hypothetical protein